MPPEAQTRLLRVLSNNEFFRVGGHVPVKANVRIIAATHQDLEKLVTNHSFREDLFHRLNVIRIHLPRLSERREDLPRLMAHFFRKAAKELDVEPKVLSSEAEAFLVKQPWPGNVRQLGIVALARLRRRRILPRCRGRACGDRPSTEVGRQLCGAR